MATLAIARDAALFARSKRGFRHMSICARRREADKCDARPRVNGTARKRCMQPKGRQPLRIRFEKRNEIKGSHLEWPRCHPDTDLFAQRPPAFVGAALPTLFSLKLNQGFLQTSARFELRKDNAAHAAHFPTPKSWYRAAKPLLKPSRPFSQRTRNRKAFFAITFNDSKPE